MTDPHSMYAPSRASEAPDSAQNLFWLPSLGIQRDGSWGASTCAYAGGPFNPC